MKVRYKWFWPDFDPQDNFFQKIISSETSHVVVTDDESPCDLEIVSVFSDSRKTLFENLRWASRRIRHVDKFKVTNSTDIQITWPKIEAPKTKRAKKRIWYTGENLRPPLLEDFDFYLSYDTNSFFQNNFYLPLGHIALGHLNSSEYSSAYSAEINESLYSGRKSNSKKSGICAFIGNAHPVRIAAIEYLRQFYEVDVYGKVSGKYVENRLTVSQRYKFTLCFENDLYPGYLTEKLIEAYRCGTIPLYWGSVQGNSELNRKSYLNLADFDSFNSWRDSIDKIIENFSSIYSEPLMHYRPDLSFLKNVLL